MTAPVIFGTNYLSIRPLVVSAYQRTVQKVQECLKGLWDSLVQYFYGEKDRQIHSLQLFNETAVNLIHEHESTLKTQAASLAILQKEKTDALGKIAEQEETIKTQAAMLAKTQKEAESAHLLADKALLALSEADKSIALAKNAISVTASQPGIAFSGINRKTALVLCAVALTPVMVDLYHRFSFNPIPMSDTTAAFYEDVVDGGKTVFHAMQTGGSLAYSAGTSLLASMKQGFALLPNITDFIDSQLDTL